MTIRFTLNLDLLTPAPAEKEARRAAEPHSVLGRDSGRARELLAKLERIRARQVASGTYAGAWDPRDIWHRMLEDCCSDAYRAG